MKLYGSFTSPFVRHCRIALLEGGLEFEFIETDQTGSAVKSPTKRVPFLEDGDLFLTDSSAILKHIREKSGRAFFADTRDFNNYCMVNTALDACVNLFFLQRDGVDLQAHEYTRRQAARIESSLAELNELELPAGNVYSDAQLRLACFLAWGLFRKRISIDAYKNLQQLLEALSHYQPFTDTAPPTS